MIDPAAMSRRPILLSALFATLLLVLCGGLAIWVLSDSGIRAGFILPEAAEIIDQTYQEKVDWHKAIESAQTAIYGRLDRYSEYLESKDFQDLAEEMTGAYHGIGVSVIEHDNGLLIMSVREGGPAADVGLMSGDIIVRVDSISLAGRDLFRASDLLRGPEGSRVKLTIIRPTSHDTLTVEPTREKIDYQHVSFAGYTKDSVIYIRLLDFEAGSSDELASALDTLLNKPGYTPKGVILDLKGNPGGLFSEAYSTSSLFLEKGKFIVGTTSRSRWNEEKQYSDGEDVTNGLPMVVIVDRGSASAAEIVAGSLHQLGRAKLVGDTTFGKGLVQGYSRFPDGNGGKLTISRYYLAGNLYLNRLDTSLSDTGKGLVPDYQLAFPENEPFIQALESSLLLMQFAQLHQDDIIAGPPPLGPDTSWAEQFAIYATHNKFSYKSDETEQAGQLMATAKAERASPRTIAALDSLESACRRLDHSEFFQNRAYITMRLKQLAIERKYGTYRSYAEAVVDARPDIRFADSLIRAERP